MASQLTPRPVERVGSVLGRGLVAVFAVALPLAGGTLAAIWMGPTLHTRNFPWITARALGIAAYLALFAMVATGAWTRHPWRLRRRTGHAETRLRVHAALGMATVALVIGHVLFLATDRYAGVGWVGAIIPGAAHYRARAVALGVVAMDLLVAILFTARLAGRPGTRHWLTVHRLAAATFAMTWFHGVLAGSDAAALRPLYVATGTFVALLYATRTGSGSRSRSEPDPLASASRRRDDDLVEAPS